MADEVTVTIEGLDKLIKRLDRAPNLVKNLAADAIARSVYLIHGEVGKYPPRPAGSTYRRTGTLGRSFSTMVDLQRFRGRVGTRLEYAGYVIGPRQAEIHRGRWKTVEDVAKKLLPDIQKIFAKAVKDLVKELAG